MAAVSRPAGPRSFNPDGLLAVGRPGERHPRYAARQAFVELKQSYLQALDGLDGADWLRHQVRAAEHPVDLWLLRGPVFVRLSGLAPGQSQRRQRLQRELDSAFPDLDPPNTDLLGL